MTFIFHPRELSDGQSTIHEREIVCGDPPEGFKRFYVRLQMQVGKNANNEPVVANAAFDMDAVTPEEAFAILPAFVAEKSELMRKEAMKQMGPKILVPGTPPMIQNNGHGANRLRLSR